MSVKWITACTNEDPSCLVSTHDESSIWTASAVFKWHKYQYLSNIYLISIYLSIYTLSLSNSTWSNNLLSSELDNYIYRYIDISISTDRYRYQATDQIRDARMWTRINRISSLFTKLSVRVNVTFTLTVCFKERQWGCGSAKHRYLNYSVCPSVLNAKLTCKVVVKHLWPLDLSVHLFRWSAEQWRGGQWSGQNDGRTPTVSNEK